MGLFSCLRKVQPEEADARLQQMDALAPPNPTRPHDHVSARLYIERSMKTFAVAETNAIAGKPPAGADRDEAIQWLCDALNSQDDAYEAPIKRLIADYTLWLMGANDDDDECDPCEDPNEPGFVRLKSLAETQLNAIGLPVERDVFEALDLRKTLGVLGDAFSTRLHRQDVAAGLLYDVRDARGKLVRQPALERLGAEVLDRENDIFYIVLLLLVAHTLDPHYKKIASAICKEHDGQFKGPAVKNVGRMVAKLQSDHADKEVPRAAENADTNRSAMIFDTPDALQKAFQTVADRLGDPLRVKNNYSLDREGGAGLFYYRAVLANYLYEPVSSSNEPKMWGPAMKEEIEVGAKSLNGALNKMFADMGADWNTRQPEDVWLQWNGLLAGVKDATRFLGSSAMQAERVRVVVEVQYMLGPYYAMRKQTHRWFKIMRAENAYSMALDYQAGGFY